LAIIKISSSEAELYSEFVDLEKEWADPDVDQVIACCGFPFDKRILTEDRIVGAKRQLVFALRPELFYGKVLSEPGFLTDDYDPKRHYLVPYQHHDSKHPSCYKDGSIEQIVNASTVRRFLEEVFGAA
jgi:hypothetical protein